MAGTKSTKRRLSEAAALLLVLVGGVVAGVAVASLTGEPVAVAAASVLGAYLLDNLAQRELGITYREMVYLTP